VCETVAKDSGDLVEGLCQLPWQRPLDRFLQQLTRPRGLPKYLQDI